MYKQKRRVIVIGLDGGDWDILKTFIDSGELPALQKIMNNGISGILYSTIHPSTPIAFPSFITGTNPGKHGCRDFVKRKEGTYDVEPINPSQMGGIPFWNVLGMYGKKSLIMNLPCTYPPKEINGIIISGMLTPRKSKDYCYPKEVFNILQDKFQYSVHFKEIYTSERERIQDFKEVTNRRTSAFLYLLEKEDFDFSMVHYRGTDVLGHNYCKYLYRDYPGYKEEEAQEYREFFLDYLRELDRNIERINRTAKDNTTIILMSDHGMVPLYKFFNVNNWLLKKGFMFPQNTFLSRLKFYFFKLGITPKFLYSILSYFKMGKLIRGRKYISPAKQRAVLQKLFFSFKDIDWSKTKAYSFTGSIDINLRGREPQGIVENGQEYEEIRNQIIRELGKLVDPDDGKKIVDKIYKREELYCGPRVKQLSDIIPLLVTGYETLGGYEFAFNRIAEKTFAISGKHRLEGIFAISGPELSREFKKFDLSILDLAPLILHILEVPIPRSMDGKVRKELFDKRGELFKKEIIYADYDEEDKEVRKWSGEEEEEIKERLRSLGYIG